MRIVIFSFFLITFSNVTVGQTAPKWMRYPAISPDGSTIAFTYKGNIYSVPTTGGQARQLTVHEAYDFMPVWSNDGKTIAFASDRYGDFDVFTMPAQGGVATRVTYHSNAEKPYSFTADDKYIIFGAARMDDAEHRQFPGELQPELYKVPSTGGRVEMVFTVPGENAQISKDGRQIIYHDNKGRENEYRKHHLSSITRDIWLYDIKSNSHKMITDQDWENRQPVFNDGEKEIYYLSEESGSFNIHKLQLADPARRSQLTYFKDFPVRFLSYAEGVISFGYDGELYTMQEGEEPKKVQVNINELPAGNIDKVISVNGGIQEMAISPNGKEIAFIARGEVFVTAKDGSFTKRITDTPEQERFVTFTADGSGVVYASEREGKWNIYQTSIVQPDEPFFYASTLLKEEVLVSTNEDNYLPAFSPDGKKLAYIANRRILRVMDIRNNRSIDLLTEEDLFSMRDGDQYFTWSPDSRWLLANWRRTMANSEVLLLATDGSKRVNLTESGYNDSNPQWVNGGRQMLWFTNRDGFRSFAVAGGAERDVYSLFFKEEDFDEFKLSKEEYELEQELNKNIGEDKVSFLINDAAPLQIDWDDLEYRKARLTIHSSHLGDAVLSKDGKRLYYLATFEKGANLWETDLRTKETRLAINLGLNGMSSLQWDKNKESLYLLNNGRITVLDPEKGSSKTVSISGEMTFNAQKEREHLFEHVYIRTKNIFYEPTFHGNDWDKLYVQYKRYLPSIGTNYEFSDMLAELLGELNVSHSGSTYGGEGIENGDATAALGIFWDYGYKGNGLKITEIIKGGPLDKSKLDIKPGSIIEKIDGHLLTPGKDVAMFLNRKADTFVLLDLVSPDGKTRKQITVRPITLQQEARLLYNRFVRINAEEVEKLSNGQLGYVHIPGMSDIPYRNAFDEIMGKYANKKGVILDTRFNGGGDLVADLAMFLTGEPFLTYGTAFRDVGNEPSWRYQKPTLDMFNESNYSDGHCFSQAYTDLKIGKTVGMPVPGTCSWSGSEVMPSGIRWGVVPISVKNKSGEWMENNPTVPQFQVKNMPDLISKGRDQQLEKAVEELLKDVR